MFIKSLGGLLLASATLVAADRADKNQYHVFKPTPDDLLREMSTDRPDRTESAYTVDAGHFQIESDLAVFSYDHDKSGGADVVTEAWSFGTLNLKVGLCNFSDFQVVLFPYTRVRTRDRSVPSTVRQSGFGDVINRLKINLWGNDGGACAGAIMPYVKWPSNQEGLGNHAIEGGVILPVSIELPHGFTCGVMTQLDWLRDSASSDYHPEFVNSITFAHDIVGKLGGYVEFFSSVSVESGSDWLGTLDLGLTYGLTENTQLDAGVNLGVTKSAPDVSPFIGFSVRF
jgi:hypothetical protein